jgi:hypothetical protein
MAHHKRRRPKNRRAGCLLCKPQKANGAKANGAKMREPPGIARRLQVGRDERTTLDESMEDIRREVDAGG